MNRAVVAGVIIAVSFLVAELWMLSSTRHHRAERASTCRTIHKPKAGCPQGFTEAPEMFTEKNGSKESGCVSPDENLEDCLDELKPGEGTSMRLYVVPNTPIEAPPDKKLRKL